MKGKMSLACFSLVIVILFAMGTNFRMHLSTRLADETQESKRIVSFFPKDLECVLEICGEALIHESKYILEVEATGKHQYVNGSLAQQVSFCKTIKGDFDENKLKDTIYVMGSGWIEDATIGKVSTGFVNYMQQGDHYVVFVSRVYDVSNQNASIINANSDIMGFRYLNLSSDKSYAVNTKKATIPYEKVANSEFIVNDEKTLQKMKEFKYGVFEKLHLDYVKEN